MKIQTYKLELVPDEHFPELKRLHYNLADVPLWDVFRRGIHPASSFNEYIVDLPKITLVMLAKLNEKSSLVPGLAAHDVGREIEMPGDYEVADGNCYSRKSESPLKGLLEHLRRSVYFVNETSYERLLVPA